MKITTKNYFDTVKKIGFEKLPLVLKQSHTVIMTKTDMGNNWSEYKNDPDLKRMIDLAFTKLEQFIKSQELSGTLPNNMNLHEEQWLMDSAEMEISEYDKLTKEHLIGILKDVLHEIKKKGYKPYLILKKDALEKLLEGYMIPKNKKVKINPYSLISKEVKFIHRFLEFHDKILYKKTVEIFIDDLQKAIKDEIITKKSPVAKDISAMQQASVNAFITMQNATHFVLKPATIKRLKEIIAKYENSYNDLDKTYIKSKKKSIPLNGAEDSTNIMRSTDFANLQFDCLGFKEKWLDFIGDPAPGFTAMVFGMPKMGKSYLCVDFAGYLARNHGKVLYVAKEEKLDKTLQDKLKDKNVAHENLFFADALPKDLSMYDFIFLDSVNKLGLTPKDLEKLKAENKGKSFIYVFQATKAGKFKGNNEFQHDVDIVIEVPEQGKAIQFGRFNQGGELDIFPDAMLNGVKKEKNPDWTEPEHLSKRDHEALKHIFQLYKEGDFRAAMDYAMYSCDTVIREEIPPDIWKKMGGGLTATGEEKLKNNEKTTALYQQIETEINNLERIIDLLGKEQKTTWDAVRYISNMHSQLAERMHDNYDKHLIHSGSILTNLKRHSSGSKKLLKELHKKTTELFKQKSVADLSFWKQFLSNLHKSFNNKFPEKKLN